MKNFSIKTVVATGIGAALFVVIGMVSIPTPVPNTSIQLQYAVQALFSLIFGPIPGFLIGFIGHALKDAIQFGAPWWTWVLSSGLFGLLVGIVGKVIKIQKGRFGAKEIIIFNLGQLLANALVWGLIAPYGDIAIYSEASNKVYAQGFVAASANAITVAIAGTLLIWAYAKTQAKSASLTKE